MRTSGAACGHTVTMKTVSSLTAALGSLLLAASLAGCGDGPTAQEVQAEHRDAALEAQQAIEAELAPLAQTGEELASATRDSCETGQHNWKVDDPYDVRCTMEVHRAYRLTGEDFRTVADSVTDTFPECADSEAEATLRDYWDELQGTQTENFEGPYRPDYLPDYRLGCGDSTDVRLTVTGWATLPADEETQQLREHGMGQPCVNSTETNPCEWDGQPARVIWGFDTAQEGWVVFVAGSQEYARTE